MPSSEQISFGDRLRNLIGGRVLLKWSEPREILRHEESQLAPVERFLFRHGGRFLAGMIGGLFLMAINLGIPDTTEEFWRSIGVIIGLGLMFAILFGIIDLTSPRVEVKELWIIRSHGRTGERLVYSELKGYAIATVPIGDDIARLLILMARDGTDIEIEIAGEITDREIDQALQKRIPRRKPPRHLASAE